MAEPELLSAAYRLAIAAVELTVVLPVLDKAEEERQVDIKKAPEYREFRRLLTQVIKASPMRKRTTLQS